MSEEEIKQPPRLLSVVDGGKAGCEIHPGFGDARRPVERPRKIPSGDDAAVSEVRKLRAELTRVRMDGRNERDRHATESRRLQAQIAESHEEAFRLASERNDLRDLVGSLRTDLRETQQECLLMRRWFAGRPSAMRLVEAALRRAKKEAIDDLLEECRAVTRAASKARETAVGFSPIRLGQLDRWRRS